MLKAASAEHLLSVNTAAANAASSASASSPGEHWNPTKHTVARPTDAYGCIDFRGGTQTNKAQVS